MIPRQKRNAITASIACIVLVFSCYVPAWGDTSVLGGELPLIAEATVIKDRFEQGVGRLELETNSAPNEVADFYRKVMEQKGWPPGMVISIGDQSVLMLQNQGDQFVLKAKLKNSKTEVIIALIIKSSYPTPQISGKLSTTDSQPLPNAQMSHTQTPIDANRETGQDLNRHQTQELHGQQTLIVPESDQAPTFSAPDFKVMNVAYWPERTRIRVKVRNNAKSFNGTLCFRLQLFDPYGPFSIDKVVSVPVSLKMMDPVWVTLLSDFQWPEPIEHPTLNAVVSVDPDNNIREQDDGNNLFQKTLRVPCGIRIEALSNTTLVQGKGSEFAIYGTFGSRQAGRVVCLEKDGNREKLHTSSWHNGTIIVSVSHKGTGSYDMVVYCSDPDTTEAYASNKKTLKIVKKATKIQLSSGNLNAKELAEALACEYKDWLSDDSTNIKKFWMEDGNPGAIVNCVFIRKPFTVILEILQQDFRVAYQEITDFAETDEGFMLSQAFPGLGPGVYHLKCMQKNYMGIIRHEQSFTFRLQ